MAKWAANTWSPNAPEPDSTHFVSNLNGITLFEIMDFSALGIPRTSSSNTKRYIGELQCLRIPGVSDLAN